MHTRQRLSAPLAAPLAAAFPAAAPMTRRMTLTLTASLASVLVLAACGGSAGGSSTAQTKAPAQPTSSAAAGSGTRSGVGPAASGTIAAVTGKTMQVQSQQNGQVAVSWAASTKFLQQVSVSAGSIKPGDCVVAVASSGSSATTTSFVATSVSVSKPVNGTCTAGFGGTGRSGAPFPGGSRPSGFPSGGALPSGAMPPSGLPRGGSQPGRAGIGALASGAVTSVSGSKLVVASRGFGPTSGSATTKKTVTVTASTKITSERSANSRAVKVGRCATAQGKADSSGTVAATRVSITDPVNGQCGGVGGFGGFGGAPAGGSNGG